MAASPFACVRYRHSSPRAFLFSSQLCMYTATANRSFATLRMTVMRKADEEQISLTATALRIPSDATVPLVILSAAKDLSAVAASLPTVSSRYRAPTTDHRLPTTRLIAVTSPCMHRRKAHSDHSPLASLRSSPSHCRHLSRMRFCFLEITESAWPVRARISPGLSPFIHQ